jgi:hypothetical protein
MAPTTWPESSMMGAALSSMGRVVRLLSRLFVDDVEDFFKRPAFGLALFPAGEFLRDEVHKRYAPRGVGCDDGVADAPHRGGKPPLALAHRFLRLLAMLNLL